MFLKFAPGQFRGPFPLGFWVGWFFLFFLFLLFDERAFFPLALAVNPFSPRQVLRELTLSEL